MQTEHVFEMPGKDPGRMPYLLYKPIDWQPGEKLPMIVFLHGAGERGEDISCAKKIGLPKLFEQESAHRCIVLCPHCVGEEIWNHRAYLIKALIETTAAAYCVDTSRISITGLSMGGFGTWEMGMSFPEMFSAIAPVCGAGMPWRAYRLKDMPVWAFHGERDTVVPCSGSQDMVNAINQCGGHAELTLYPHVGHDAWVQAYEQSDLVQWLLNQKRK